MCTLGTPPLLQGPDPGCLGSRTMVAKGPRGPPLQQSPCWLPWGPPVPILFPVPAATTATALQAMVTGTPPGGTPVTAAAGCLSRPSSPMTPAASTPSAVRGADGGHGSAEPAAMLGLQGRAVGWRAVILDALWGHGLWAWLCHGAVGLGRCGLWERGLWSCLHRGAAGQGEGACGPLSAGQGQGCGAGPWLTHPAGGLMFRLDSWRDGWHAWPQGHSWPGLQGDVDAAFAWDGRTYLIQVGPPHPPVLGAAQGHHAWHRGC